MTPASTRSSPRLLASSLLLAAAACTACGEQEFRVQHAPDVPRGGIIAMFGIYKDGRLDTSAWEHIALKLLRKESCPPGFTSALAEAQPAVHGAVDKYVRDNGVTEKLLDLLAPAAASDRIMVITIAGGPPQVLSRSWLPDAPTRRTKSAGGGRYRSETDGGSLVVSAEVFSVKQHRFVEQVSMSYGGKDTAGALSRFADKLAAEIPVSACGGWNWKLRLDEERIRKLESEE